MMTLCTRSHKKCGQLRLVHRGKHRVSTLLAYDTLASRSLRYKPREIFRLATIHLCLPSRTLFLLLGISGGNSREVLLGPLGARVRIILTKSNKERLTVYVLDWIINSSYSNI